VWDKKLFDLFAPADACLIIHNTEEFGERLHRAVQRTLPSWAGIDGVVEYGQRAAGPPLPRRAPRLEQEWLFAWRSMQPQASLNPVTVKLGSLENFAELRPRHPIWRNSAGFIRVLAVDARQHGRHHALDIAAYHLRAQDAGHVEVRHQPAGKDDAVPPVSAREQVPSAIRSASCRRK
jgi:hypothetical protein